MRSKRIVRIVAAAATPIILAVAVYLILRPSAPEKRTEAGVMAGAEATRVSSLPGPAPKTVEDIIRPGETASEILENYGLSPAEIDRLATQIKPVFNLAKIIAGRTMKLTFDPEGNLRTLEYPLDQDQFLRVTGNGPDYHAEKISFPFETRLAFVNGLIDEHLYGAILAQGEGAGLAIEIEQIFGWDIDFYAGLQPGDVFRLIVEKKYLDGRFQRYGNILAAEFWNDGRRIDAYRFEYDENGVGKRGFYHADGRSLRKEFLKSPLLSYRITSRFTSSRLHPIRKVYRAHYGVDYAAPIGTPVFATADGKVEEARWNGDAGRMIRLSHKNGYETLYLHLSEIGVRVGRRVTGGERIGKVGSSGGSTGPHLDYRIKHLGSYLNPLSAKFLPVEPLPGKWMTDFQKNVGCSRFLLDLPLTALLGLF